MPARAEPQPTVPGEQPGARGLDVDISAYDELEGADRGARGVSERAQTPRRA